MSPAAAALEQLRRVNAAALWLAQPEHALGVALGFACLGLVVATVWTALVGSGRR